MDFKETHAEGTLHFMAFKGPKLGGLNCNLVWHLTKNNTEARSPSRPDTIGWQQSQNSFQISKSARKRTGFSCLYTVLVSTLLHLFCLLWVTNILSKCLSLCPYLLPQLFRSHWSLKKALKIRSYF